MKWSTAALLFLVVVLLMIANSSAFFFHQPFYEIDDWAANSISINRAKQFAELYGNYSRWGFNHPGPAFFYLYALGEWLFFDTLHLVPAPFNGQLLIHLLLMTGYFVVVLVVFSRWLPRGGRPWFLPVALILSALHFASMANLAPDLSYTLHAPSAIASPWSAHALVMPMLALMTAGASVAAGRGRHLPLLAVAIGCLIHAHVAQPLFIIPSSLLAYAGLCWRGWRTRRAPWREFGRAHVWALVILALFAAPIVADFFRGPNSNFSLILNHIRHHKGEHKTLLRSFFYFLQFGTYTEYAPYRNDFGHYSMKGMVAYLNKFSLYYVFWVAVTALALRPLVLALRRPAVVVSGEETLEPTAHRFLAWGGVFLVVTFGLTLYWGVIQDGDMTYFNAWFNFSIYQFGALLALAALCARPVTKVATGTGERWHHWAPGMLGGAAALAVFLFLAKPLRIESPVPTLDRITQAAVAQAIADSNVPGQPPPTKLLIFTQETWEIAAGIALQLDRAKQPFVVLDQWVKVVGKKHRWRDYPAGYSSLKDMELFRLHARLTNTAKQPAYALQKVGAALTIVPSLIDPTDEANSTIQFRPKGNNFLGFHILGWSGREDWGVWTDGYTSLLAFHPRSVGGGDVEMHLDVLPLIAPELGLKKQKMRIFFNGEEVGKELMLTKEEHDLVVTIPGEQWEQAAKWPALYPTVLEFRLPSAVAPAIIDPAHANGDMRLLAMGFHEIRFSKAESAPKAADSPEPTDAKPTEADQSQETSTE